MRSGVCCLPPLRPYWIFPEKVNAPSVIPSYVLHVRLEETLNTVLLFCLGSGNMCNVLSPSSVLLSAIGSLAFKSCARYEDVASYKAPEVRQGHTTYSRNAAEKVGKLKHSKK